MSGESIYITWQEDWGVYEQGELKYFINDEEIIPEWKRNKLNKEIDSINDELDLNGINITVTINKNNLNSIGKQLITKSNLKYDMSLMN